MPNGLMQFKKLKLQRPTVIRVGEVVKTCYYYNGTHQCLGVRCFWPTVGKCPIYNRLKSKMLRAK